MIYLIRFEAITLAESSKNICKYMTRSQKETPEYERKKNHTMISIYNNIMKSLCKLQITFGINLI